MSAEVIQNPTPNTRRNRLIGLIVAVVLVGLWVYSVRDWHQIWKIVSAADNVPIVAMLFLVPFFTWLGIKQAKANDRLIGKLEGDASLAKTHHRKVEPWRPGWAKELHVWPYLVRIEFLAAVIVTVILYVWSIALNAPLEEPANPNLTMNPSKAPWYFLGLQEMLVYFDPWNAGVVMPSLIIVGLMVIPFIDINPKGNGYYCFKDRKYEILTFFLGFHVLWVSMIMIGTFFRGPGWNLFWPWQRWDPHKVVALTNVDLPYLFGFRDYVWSAIFGLVVIGAYFVIATSVFYFWVLRVKGKEFMERWGMVRFLITALLFVTMLALPAKMFLRLVFNVKYILVTPWLNI